MAGKSAADTPAALGLVGLFLLLCLFPVLFLLLPALLLLFLLPGGSLLCGLQGFFQVAVVSTGIALIMLKQRKGLHTKKDGRGVYIYAHSKKL